MDDDFKLALSRALVLLAIIIGALFVVVVVPGTIFMLGNNYNLPEVLAELASLLSLLPASILAVWKRLWAGVWLTAAGGFFAVAAQWDKYAITQARGIHVAWGEIIGVGFLGWIVLAFGLFLWITDRRGWPRIRLRNVPVL